jgi:hypothetical protein
MAGEWKFVITVTTSAVPLHIPNVVIQDVSGGIVNIVGGGSMDYSL